MDYRMTKILGETEEVIIKGVEDKRGVKNIMRDGLEDVNDKTEDKYHKSRKIYDDIFKTLATRKSRWLIPLVNELFMNKIPESSEVKLMNETHYIKRNLDEKGNNVEK